MAKAPEHSTDERTAERRAASEKRRQAAESQLAAEQTHRDASVAETNKKMDTAQPTPTQRETDLARLGAPVEEKEDDRSGPDLATKVVAPAGAPGSYQTRQVPAGGPGPAHARDDDKK